MRKKITLPCSAIAEAQIIGSLDYKGFGTYVKLLQLMQKMPDQCLPKENMIHVAQSNGMELFIVEQLLENTALFISDHTRYFAVEEKVIHKKEKESGKTEMPLEHPLQLWVKNGDAEVSFPRINSLPRQLSSQDCVNLINKFPKKLIKETIIGMEAWGPLTEGSRKKSSVYMTLLVWCQRAINSGWKPKEETAPKLIRATAV